MRVKTALAPKKLISIAQMKPKAQKICLQSDLRAHLVSVLFKFSFSLRNINKKKLMTKLVSMETFGIFVAYVPVISFYLDIIMIIILSYFSITYIFLTYHSKLRPLTSSRFLISCLC